jgi:S1-C subfamily serine protease
MFKTFFTACVLQALLICAAVTSGAEAAGPYGSIKVGAWIGGAFTDDGTGAFSHCAATTSYGNGVTLVVGQGASNAWILGFANPAFRYSKGESVPIDIVFDGQSGARIFANAASQIMITAPMPPNVARTLQKSSMMAASTASGTFQFNLTSIGPLMPILANCVARIKAGGINSAGDFSAPKPVAAKSEAPSADAANGPKPGKSSGKAGGKAGGSSSGTGFVISPNGHIVTNNHVISGCGEIHGNLTGEATATLRVVSTDRFNDLALLQGPAASFREFAKIRDRTVRSGDSVVAIGFPYHGLLTSDFTVTTGIVSSLSGMMNDSRFLQITAPVQPGNSGGPLLDTSGQIVGVVSSKLDGIRFASVTGNIPENINFAIKTGALRDFLDNSVVPYQTAEPKADLKTPEIAGNARAHTLLITCDMAEQAEKK